MTKPNQRKSIRFSPDPGTLAQIEIPLKDGAFAPKDVGLVLNESNRGCAVVVTRKSFLKAGELWRIKIGHLEPLKAQIKWVTELDMDVQKVGLQYLE
ncbi:hypothetical protein WDW86_13045 [Bdellovibrionota bacterium FG-2]